MFLIDKKISVGKPLSLRSITKYDNVLHVLQIHDS